MMQRTGKLAIGHPATGSIALALTIAIFSSSIEPGYSSTTAFDQERNAGYRALISKEYAVAEEHYLKAFEKLKGTQEAPYKVALLHAEYGDVLARMDRPTEAINAYKQAISAAEQWMGSAPDEQKFGFEREINNIRQRLALVTNNRIGLQKTKTRTALGGTKNNSSTRSQFKQRIEAELRRAEKQVREDHLLAAIQTLQKAIDDCKDEMGSERDKPTWQNHRLLSRCLDQLARAYLKANQPSQAKDVLVYTYKLKQKLLFEGFPSLVQTTALLGIAQAKLGDRLEARRLFESSLENADRLSRSDREDVQYHLLVLTEQDGRIAEAHSLLSNYIELTVPKTASPAGRYDLLSGLASRLTQDSAPNLGDFCLKRAHVSLKKMEKPDDEDRFSNQLSRVDTLLRAQRYTEGEALCLELTKMVTNNLKSKAACYRLLAYAQLQLRKFDQAEVTVAKALELNKSVMQQEPKAYEETLFYATQIAEAQPDTDKLELLLDRISTSNVPKTSGMAKIKAVSYMTLANKEWVLHRYEKAQRHFSEAYSQWTILPIELRVNLGVATGDIAINLEQPLKAVTCFQECQKIASAVPKHISDRALRWRLGFALCRLGRFEESQQQLQQALNQTAETNDVELEMKSLLALGEVYIATKQFSCAQRLIDVYSQKTDSAISRAIMSYIAGQIGIKEGKIESGRKSLIEAANLFSRLGDDLSRKQAECYTKIAATYATKDDSLTWLNKALSVYHKIDSDHQGEGPAATYFAIGTVYSELRKEAEAATAFNTALEALKYSNSPSAFKLRSQIRQRQRVPKGRS